MQRRQFIAGLGSAAAWPVIVRAQQGERVRRIGALVGRDENDPMDKARISAFRMPPGDRTKETAALHRRLERDVVCDCGRAA